MELDDDGSFDPETVVLPFLFAESLVNRTTHNGGGSEGSFTALLQKNKDGGVIWGQIKYTPINLYFMQLGAIALLNEVFLTQDYETVAVPAASAVRAITSVYLTRDVENLRGEDMDVFLAILNEYQAMAMGIASSSEPRAELQEIVSSVESDSSPLLEALELGDSIVGPVIADQARAARDAILQKIEHTELRHLGERFANILLEATLVEVVGLMGALATEDVEEASTPDRRAASSAIANRLEGPRASSDFTRVAVGLLAAIYIRDSRTEDESDEDIFNQINELYKCVDLSSSERQAVNECLDAWDKSHHGERVEEWIERDDSDGPELMSIADHERSWFENSFNLLVTKSLDLSNLAIFFFFFFFFFFFVVYLVQLRVGKVYNTGDTNENGLLDRTETWSARPRARWAPVPIPTMPWPVVSTRAPRSRCSTTTRPTSTARSPASMSRRRLMPVDPSRPTAAEDADDPSSQPLLLNMGTLVTFTTWCARRRQRCADR